MNRAAHSSLAVSRPSPVLRWAGSKRRLLPVLLSAVPAEFGRYYEPFVGSACLFFALSPSKAILGDVNSDLIDAYSVIRSQPVRVAHAVHSMPSTARHYYRLRSVRPATLRPIARAARFVYLNRHCFNGVYRINRTGQFNVPRGKRTGALPAVDEFKLCAKALWRAKLRAEDFESSLRDVQAGDFVYLDPPYASTTRTTYGEYSYDSFEQDDLPRLLKTLRRLDRLGATFLLSYTYRSTLRVELSHWHIRRVAVQRHVAGFADHRHRVYEILVSNKAFA